MTRLLAGCCMLAWCLQGAAAEAMEPTVLRDDAASLDIPTWITPHAGSARSVNIRRCRLTVTGGPDAGRRVELAQRSIVIGRTGGDLQLTDPKVSSLHAALELAPDGYRLRDLDSSNGIYVGVLGLDSMASTTAPAPVAGEEPIDAAR